MSRLVRLLLVGAVVALGLVVPVQVTSAAVAPLQIATASLPSVVQGKPYPSTQLKASGGAGFYTWKVVSPPIPGTGTLMPYGMKLSPTGRISGANGHAIGSPYNITFQVRDLRGVTATRTLQIVVKPFVITTTALPVAHWGLPYRTVLKTDGACLYGGTMGWSSPNLPPGFKFASGGVLTGKPTTVGTTNITVWAQCSLFNNGFDVKVLPLTVT